MKRISVEEFPSISHCAQSLALYRELDDKAGMANSLEYLGWVEFSSAHSAPAQARFEESLTLRRALDDKRGIANSLSALGYVADSWGEQAATLFEESLALCYEKDTLRIARRLVGLAGVAMAQQQTGRATRLCGAASAAYDVDNYYTRPGPGDRADCERVLATARAVLNEPDFTAAWIEGNAMPTEQAITYALEPSVEDTG